MTKRKASPGSYSALELALYRCRRIGMDLEEGAPLASEDAQFLGAALQRIGAGEDASTVLGVAAKRGQRRTVASRVKAEKLRFALSWIAASIRPKEEGGLGLSLDKAFECAAEPRSNEASFGLSEDSLRQYWKDYPEFRTASFPRPISSLPNRRPKPGKKP